MTLSVGTPAVTFTELGVAPSLVAALSRQRITEPTAIQTAALPVLIAGRDAYLNAETGTGKTLAYLLPIYSRLEVDPPATQAVIVAPTHELAIQIQRVSRDLAHEADVPIRTLLLIGGTSMERQIDGLKTKPHLVVGSPGRIAEWIDKGRLKTRAFRTIVLDEADRLLTGESLAAVRSILEASPRGRQVVFASATETPEVAELLTALAPGVVMVRTAAAPTQVLLEHFHLVCETRDKPELLRKLMHALRPERALVFVHRNETAERVAANLAHHKIPAADLHAGSDKRNRQRAMDDFRSARVRVLIASDVAARGLDIAGVTHVFNLDVPTESKAYLHRVGRTARAGAKGQAVTLMTTDELRLVRRFEHELGIVMHRVRLREGRLVPDDARESRDASRAGTAASVDQRLRPSTKRR